MQSVIVKNNEKRLHRVAFISDKGHMKNIKLMPGINIVPKKDWDIAAKNPALKHDFAKKHLVVEGESKIDEKTGLASVQDDDAKELILGCVDEEMLVSWLDVEKRPGVKFAIEEQLRKVMVKNEENKGE